MGVWKPKNSPFWQYEFAIDGRKFRGPTGTASKREAQKIETIEREKVIAKRTGARPPLSINDLCKRYFADVALGSDSEANTDYQLEAFCLAFGETTMVHELKMADFIRYRRDRKAVISRRGKPVSDSTVNREIETFRAAWRYVNDLEEFALGSVPKWGKLLVTVPNERNRELKNGEESALLPALAKRSPELALMVEFAILSGQRKTAVVTLQWDNLDLDNRSATILLKGRGKVKREHRFPLTPRMIEIIRAFPRLPGVGQVFTYVARRTSPIRKDRPARFAGMRYPFTAQGWKRDWSEALKEAGVTNFRFHDLRHTAATRATRATGNLAVTKKLLGHSNISTTLRYAHAADSDVYDALMAVERTQRRDKGSKGTKVVPIRKRA